MTLDDVITHWANHWRSLAAWGAVIPMAITTAPYQGGGVLGRAHCHQGQAIVYLTGDLAEDLATALHELAHLAAPLRVNHDRPWRLLFVRGVAEACGCDPGQFEIDVRISDLDAQVRDAVSGWLVRSGQATVLRAIGVLKASSR